MVAKPLFPKVWLAFSLQKTKGKGVLQEGEFEVFQEEEPIIFSALELLRERLVLYQDSINMISCGREIFSHRISWQDGVAEVDCVHETNQDVDVWFQQADGELDWTIFAVDGGCFFSEFMGKYREIIPLRGVEDASYDVRLQSLSDESLDEVSIADTLSLRHWTLTSSALRIFLERPEYHVLRKLDLCGMVTETEELGGVLRSSWHGGAITELCIDHQQVVRQSLCNMNNLTVLRARDVGWTVFDLERPLTVLDLRENPLESCVLSSHLRCLGLDVSFEEMSELEHLHTLYVKNVQAEHVPRNVKKIFCDDVIGDINLSSYCDLLALRIPAQHLGFSSSRLQDLTILGGEWSVPQIKNLLLRFPNLHRLCFEKAKLENGVVMLLGHMKSIAIRDCAVERLLLPEKVEWERMDVSNNPLLTIDDWSFATKVESLNISKTAIDLQNLILSPSMIDVQNLFVNNVMGGEAFFQANAMLSLERLSFRGCDVPVMSFLSNHALLQLKELDFGENKTVQTRFESDFARVQLRVDPQHPQQDMIRWMWREHGHFDIFHAHPRWGDIDLY